MKKRMKSKGAGRAKALVAMFLLAASLTCSPYSAWADDSEAAGQTDVTVVRSGGDDVQEAKVVEGATGTQKASAVPKTGDTGFMVAICVSSAFVLFSIAAAGIALRSGPSQGAEDERKEVLHGKE